MSSNDEVARNFARYYYELFATNRANLASLYNAESMLTFEGAASKGAQAIVEKLSSLPIAQVIPEIDTLDAQPSNPSVPGAMIIFVTGRLQIDAEAYKTRFSQTFQLIPSGSSYFIYNDIFRLNYGS